MPTETAQEHEQLQQQTGAAGDNTPEELDDNSTCFICAEPITFWSTGVCGHKTCQ